MVHKTERKEIRMKNAWIVIRYEKHIDDRFWVCLQKDDALKIAADVTAYWKTKYEPEEVDETLYEDQIFHFDAEDMFRVVVQPQEVRETGERDCIEAKR